jgi:hypothetical protein
MCRRRAACETVWQRVYLLSMASVARKMISERIGTSECAIRNSSIIVLVGKLSVRLISFRHSLPAKYAICWLADSTLRVDLDFSPSDSKER